MSSARTPAQAARLERVIGLVLRAGVLVSSVCLSAGLLLSLSGVEPAASLLLNAGIVVLLATPVSRVIVSTVEYIAERDWTFATLTVVVLLELIASAAAALVFKRKL
ncbi:MAG: putative rane protein [Acidobacteria bacterium]|nr:putative rane protein [Acidobacteriota bacterium]